VLLTQCTQKKMFTTSTSQFDRSIKLDDHVYGVSREIHLKNPWASRCRRTIMDAILSQGEIQVYRGTERLTPAQTFRRMLDNEWVQFVRDAMDEIWTRGLVPVTIKLSDNTGEPYPVVVRGPHVITTEYDMKLDRQAYRFYRTVSKKTNAPIPAKLDRKVFILNGFGSDPGETGEINSLVSTIVRDAVFTQAMDSFAMLAESISCDPSLYVESEKIPMDPESASEAYYGDKDRINARQEDRIQMNKTDIDIVIAQRQEFNQVWKRMFGDKTVSPIERMMRNEKKPEIPLTVGKKLVHQVMPKSRNDLINMHGALQELICGVYGVPRTIISDAGKSAYSGVKTNVDTFNQTILSWKKTLSRLMTDVYNRIYLENDVRYFLSQMDEEKREQLTVPDVVKMKGDSEVILTFPIVPYETQGDLITKFLLDIIDWNTFYEFSRRLSGLPVGEVTNKTSPWNNGNKSNLLVAFKDSLMTDVNIVKKETTTSTSTKRKEPEKKDKGKNKEKEDKGKEKEDKGKEKKKEKKEKKQKTDE
jgi:hypothetical protein